MRILFLTPQLPYPPHQGTALRNFGLIQGLSERHRVSLLSFAGLETALPEVPGPLATLCERVEVVPTPPLRALTRRAFDTCTHPLPDMALRLASAAFAARLAAWLEQEPFDVVHVEGIEMAPYLEQLRAGDRRPTIILDEHNCEYMLQRRYAQVDARIPRRWPGALYSVVQWQKLRRYEHKMCKRADHVLAVSQADAAALQRLVPGLETTVVPNGIDTGCYTPPTPEEVERAADGRPTLVFVGKMDFRPNVDAVRWFITAIWPRVRSAVPAAHFVVVGQRPHRQLEFVRGDPAVTLTGWVDDLRPYVIGASVYVAPLRMGSGTRLKLLEAMAFEKAIVSTRMGAEGLTDPEPASLASSGAAHDRELMLVPDNDPAAFAEAVVALLRDPAQRARLGRAARAFVQAHYDWRVIMPRLENLYTRQLGAAVHSAGRV